MIYHAPVLMEGRNRESQDSCNRNGAFSGEEMRLVFVEYMPGINIYYFI